MPTNLAVDDGKIPFNKEFHTSYKKYVADLILERAKNSNEIIAASLQEFNYLGKIGGAVFQRGQVETAYLLIDLDRTGYIKLSNIRFEPNKGSFPSQGSEYFNKKLTTDKFFEIVKRGYLINNSFAQIKFDIYILKNPLDFVRAETAIIQDSRSSLTEIFKVNLLEWRCLICGSQIEKISNSQQLFFYLNGFSRQKYVRCHGKKHRHMNWYEIDYERATITFYARFHTMAETVELRLDIRGVTSETNKYFIPKSKRSVKPK